MDNNNLKRLEDSLEEIKQTQNKIAVALLGDYEKNTVGLIEESRTIRREVDVLKAQTQIHDAQIQQQEEFRKDAKKVVAGIAIVVPFLFELIKLGVAALFEVFKNNPK